MHNKLRSALLHFSKELVHAASAVVQRSTGRWRAGRMDGWMKEGRKDGRVDETLHLHYFPLHFKQPIYSFHEMDLAD